MFFVFLCATLVYFSVLSTVHELLTLQSVSAQENEIWLWDWDSCVKSAKGLKSNTRSRYTCKVVPYLVRDYNGYHSPTCMSQWIIPVVTNASVGGSSINIESRSSQNVLSPRIYIIMDFEALQVC